MYGYGIVHTDKKVVLLFLHTDGQRYGTTIYVSHNNSLYIQKNLRIQNYTDNTINIEQVVLLMSSRKNYGIIQARNKIMLPPCLAICFGVLFSRSRTLAYFFSANREYFSAFDIKPLKRDYLLHKKSGVNRKFCFYVTVTQ